MTPLIANSLGLTGASHKSQVDQGGRPGLGAKLEKIPMPRDRSSSSIRVGWEVDMLFKEMSLIYPGALDRWFGLEGLNVIVLNRGRGLRKEEKLFYNEFGTVHLDTL